ncbi:MAG: acetylxylan esterase [Lentisphaeria bacterium]|nr:acetylxylan esterase [Lentisphaeria bacterium]
MLISAERSRQENTAFWANFKNRISEDRVPPYTLPDPLQCFDGRRISSREEYLQYKRPELLRFYQDKLYGTLPPAPDRMDYTLLKEKKDAFSGLATRKEILIRCSMEDGRAMEFPLLLYIPNKRNKRQKCPVFLTLNFYGNHTTVSDPEISVADHWLPFQWRGSRFQTMEMRAAYRGSQELSDRAWESACREALSRGYAMGTVCYEYFMPDNGYHFEHSIYQLFHEELDYMSENRNFGAIGAWTWGVSRTIDALEQQEEIDTNRLALVGHSRLGKTALWAGVNDERIKLTVSNNSGCGGAKLFHRDFGETLRVHAFWRPFWYSLGVQEYAEKEWLLPVDQHELIGMIAPRLVYIGSASEDHGADPKGEFLSSFHAGKVYNLFGLEGLPGDGEYPSPGTKYHSGAIAYHLREGSHSLTLEDYRNYFDYADLHL